MNLAPNTTAGLDFVAHLLQEAQAASLIIMHAQAAGRDCSIEELEGLLVANEASRGRLQASIQQAREREGPQAFPRFATDWTPL